VAGEIVRYLEPLNDDERAFLKRVEVKERGSIFKAVQILMSICFILPFAMAWGEAIVGKPNPFSVLRYFTGVAILGFLSAGGVFFAYRSKLYQLQRDLRESTKTVERTTITRKRYMPQNDTCYFYLNSPTKLSIEVSLEHFEQWQDGDELSIEYATNSKEYLGYF
jgi:hypothetical protein